MPLCLGESRSVRASSRSPVAVMRARGPHLLPVHDPRLAVGDRPRPQTREIGTGAGLGEQLAPHVLAAQHRAEKALLLLVGAPRDDRRAGHRDADREHTGRDVEPGLLLVEDPLLPAGATAAAELLGPGDARPARVVQRLLPRLAGAHVGRVGRFAGIARRVEVLGVGSGLAALGARLEPRTRLRPEFLFLGRLLEVHA